VDNLLWFPQRRICALGLADDALSAVRAAMPYVAVATDGAALQCCDLLLLDHADHGAPELARWIHERKPEFPILLWYDDAIRFLSECRRMLFPPSVS
jgi:hypothetical protein